MNRMSYLDNEIRRLSREWSKKKPLVEFQQYDGQRASVSCPPDVYLHIRGGWLTTGHGQQFYTDELTLNFGLNPGGTYGVDSWYAPPVFTNANYYCAAVVHRYHDWDSTARRYGTRATVNFFGVNPTTEASSAECSEAWADYELHYTLDKYYGYPICIVILKNDGITDAMEPGVRGHILPIDAVNRGRSYLWRDIRPLVATMYPDAAFAVTGGAPTCT